MPCFKQRQWISSNHAKHNIFIPVNWFSFWWKYCINFIVPKEFGLMIFHLPTLIIYNLHLVENVSQFSNRCLRFATFCVPTSPIGASNLRPRISLEALHDFLSRLAIINRRTTPEDYITAVQPPGVPFKNTTQTGGQQNAWEFDWKKVPLSDPKNGVQKTSTVWEVHKDKRSLRNGIVLFQTANF